MYCECTILSKDFGNKLVVAFHISDEQWGQCETCSTLLSRPRVTTVVSL